MAVGRRSAPAPVPGGASWAGAAFGRQAIGVREAGCCCSSAARIAPLPAYRSSGRFARALSTTPSSQAGITPLVKTAGR